MKQLSTTSPLRRFVTSSSLVACAVMMTVSGSVAVYADTFDDQINALNSQIGSYQAQAAALSQQANTLQTAIATLQAQEDTVQAQINLSQAKHDQLVAQIQQTETNISKNQDVLAQTISQQYVNGTISPIEMLASSKNVSNFLDQQEYRSSVNNQVNSAIKQIKALKKSLEDQKAQVEQVIADEQGQKNVLAAKQTEQANLLAETQGTEAGYQNIIGAKNSQISSLKAQQAAANAARLSNFGGSVTPGDPSHGGYPAKWDNPAKDATYDDWGMFNRECVSYTAWRVFHSGQHMPYWGGEGNANQWPGDADAAGIPRGSTPRVGSIGIALIGAFGHAAYVEAVSGNSVRVSQYNWDLAGHYSEMTVSASFFNTYIYFGG